MGTTKNPLLSKGKGRIGNIILYNVDGEQRMRSLPLQVHNPKTPAQRLNRVKFNYIQACCREFKVALRFGFQQRQPGWSLSNMFYHHNHTKVRMDTSEGLNFVWEEVICSYGPLSAPNYKYWVEEDTHMMRIELLPQKALSSTYSSDRVIFFVMNTVKIRMECVSELDRFTPQIVQVDLASSGELHELVLYAFAFNMEERLSSTSTAHRLG